MNWVIQADTERSELAQQRFPMGVMLDHLFKVTLKLLTYCGGELHTFFVVQFISLASTKHRPASGFNFWHVMISGNDMIVNMWNNLSSSGTFGRTYISVIPWRRLEMEARLPLFCTTFQWPLSLPSARITARLTTGSHIPRAAPSLPCKSPSFSRCVLEMTRTCPSVIGMISRKARTLSVLRIRWQFGLISSGSGF